MAQRIEIEVTQGNLNNNHLYLRSHPDFFPTDAVGAANRHDGEGQLLTVHFDGLGEPVRTDIAGGNKLFLRDRGSWGRFYAWHKLRAGDRVTIERIGDYEYAISPPRTSAKVGLRERGASTLRAASRLPDLLAPAERKVVPRLGRFPEFRDRIEALPIPLSESGALRPQLSTADLPPQPATALRGRTPEGCCIAWSLSRKWGSTSS